MKMYEIKCPGCGKFDQIKNDENKKKKCSACGCVLTNEDVEKILDAAWENHQKELEQNKRDKFYHNEDGDIIFGPKILFENTEEFEEKALEELRELDPLLLEDKEMYVLENIRTDTFISTAKGIEAESCTPIRLTDVSIEVLYVADVGVE